MESVGFKEWALVCEALGRGEQCVILRKGGISEGREGFAFQHREFFLFPTFFHEQIAKTRFPESRIPETRMGEIEIQFFAKLEMSAVVTSWETAIALAPFHILQPDVVRERFDYNETPGVHAAFVRVFRLAEPWMIPDLPMYGGCRSWVKLPDAAERLRMEPVLSDEEHGARLKELRDLLRAA